jgi:putative ABC transport system substrate-binding protein
VSSSLRGALSGAVAGVFTDYAMLGERAALILLQVLEGGVDPARIPVGTMRGYQVVVNLGAARRLGYDLPLPLLAVADRILDDRSADEAEERR